VTPNPGPAFLRFLLLAGRHAEFREALCRPGGWRGPWPDDAEALIDGIEESLAEKPAERLLLHLSLLADALVYRERLSFDEIRSVTGRVSPSSLLHEALGWEACLAGRWLVFPVALALNGNDVVRYFLAGAVAGPIGALGLPDWAEGLMDGDARAALERAASLPQARNHIPAGCGLFVAPLLAPLGSVQIAGRSLELAAFLALSALADAQPWPPGVIATGEIGPDGARVGRVGMLSGKAEAAARAGFKALLYPAGNDRPPECDGLEAVPVRTVDEARLFTRLYAPGCGRELILFSEMLEDPRAFVGGMERIDPRWVDWARGQGRLRPAVEGIFKEPSHLKSFSRSVRAMAADWKLEQARTFTDLVEPGDIERGAGVSAAATLEICTAALSVCNHRGDIAAAEKWAGAGGRVLAAARRSDLDACADFVNNRLVLNHNRYRFDPEPGSEFDALIEALEQRRLACSAAGCVVDAKLGELHGTLAQNYGFCGPGHLGDCLRHAARAMDAFGRCAVPEFFPDYLRQLGYLVYACLDSGDGKRAFDALGAYTGTQGWDDVLRKTRENRLTRWHHAAVARYLAENPAEMAAEAYLALVRDEAPRTIEEGHPWQLWLWNLGRIAVGNRLPSSARRLFEQSLRLCRLEKLGPTVRLMALLPLSGLRLLESLPEDMAAIETEIRRAAEAIDAAGFNRLLENPLSKALEPLWWKPEAFFPFTYR
jgi:hypothetical protein